MRAPVAMYVTSESSTRDVVESQSVRRFGRIWLALLFFLGIGYVFILPPYQAIDEFWHWHRVWSVVQGDYNCKQMSGAAEGFTAMAYRYDWGPPTQRGPVSWTIFDDMYRYKGEQGTFPISTAACKYPPIGYLPAGVMTRLITPGAPLDLHEHKMFYAFYGSRIANWLWFFGCVVAAFRFGRYPMIPLVFASIPMVVQQAMSINNDAMQFGCLLLAGALLTRSPARVSWWSAMVLIGLATAIKPMNAVAAILIWISLWVAKSNEQIELPEALGTALAAVLVPVGMWALWMLTMDLLPEGSTTFVPVAGVNRDAQLELMRAEPLKFLYILGWQVKQLFTGNPADGGWRGMFLVLGTVMYYVPAYVYALAVSALLSGFLSIRYGARGQFSGHPVPRIFLIAACGGLVLYLAAITITLYLEFTPPGSEIVMGVQARYYHYAALFALFFVAMTRRSSSGLATARKYLAHACLVLALLAHVTALWSIRVHYWEAASFWQS